VNFSIWSGAQRRAAGDSSWLTTAHICICAYSSAYQFAIPLKSDSKIRNGETVFFRLTSRNMF
jgi:hypothetical protein